MKILLISFSNNYDHQLSLYSLYEELVKKNVDVGTIGIRNPKVNFNFSENNMFFDVPNRPGITIKALDIKLLRSIYKIIDSKSYDVIYFESLHIWNVYLFKKLRHKSYICHSIHDIIPHEGKQSFFIKKFNQIIFKNVDKVILRSAESYKYCLDELKVKENKIAYLPLGRKWKDFSDCLNTNRVLFFGRLAKYKGLNSLKQICQDLPYIKFDIVGKPVDKEDGEIIESLKHFKNINIVSGYVSEEIMVDFFKNSDCVILPYNSATQSGVVVDSYLMSRPCIAFNVGALKEQIDDGKSGFLVNNDIKDFENKIAEYINFPIKRKKEMCIYANYYGKLLYSAENLANQFMELMYKILEKQNDNN